MASSSSKSVSSLLFIAAILISVALFPSPCHCSSSDHHQKVNLSVYYETLCPPCAQFIVENLINIFNNGIIDIVNLKLIPWGNAHLTVNGTNNTNIICQNGPDECRLNRVQACAIDVLNNVDKSYGLISCMELFVLVGQHQSWPQCFETLGLSNKEILNCSRTANGTKLDVLHAQETASLVPHLTFVPWVVVNNQSIGKDYGNFTTYVCKEYKGQLVPEACSRNHVAVMNSGHDLGCENDSVL
ncbi:Gamma-interferon-responsive lysosomal thiol protein [Linum perenne]